MTWVAIVNILSGDTEEDFYAFEVVANDRESAETFAADGFEDMKPEDYNVQVFGPYIKAEDSPPLHRG